MLLMWVFYSLVMLGWLEKSLAFRCLRNHQGIAELDLRQDALYRVLRAFTMMTVATQVWRWSLIPVIGVLSNLYLIAGFRAM